MRNKQVIEQSIKDVFTKYQEQFGGEGFADNDIPQIIKRTISRKRVEFLDKQIDTLDLTQAELDNWQVELDAENSAKAEKLFEDYIQEGNLEMAEYQINNYRKVWSAEKRTELAKRINPDFTVCPHEDLVVTQDQARQTQSRIDKAEEKRLRKESKKAV